VGYGDADLILEAAELVAGYVVELYSALVSAFGLLQLDE
jgi:hypothetical protein